MKCSKYLILILTLLFLNPVELKAQKIVYINMEKIMKESKAGKIIIDKINKTNEKNIKKFKEIEESLKKEETDLIAKKNVLSEEEFQKKFDLLSKKINDYRTLRQSTIQDTTKKRISASAEFSQKIKPILGEYATKNNISVIFQKKNIIMGKTELDITDEILKIVDQEISKIKFD